MGKRQVVIFGLAVLAAVAAGADRVLLTNGEVFEEVIAESADDQRVTIRMASGSLRLPRSMVLRIDRQESGLGRYLERRRQLERDADASAEAWLELAYTAQALELAYGVREAALRAAEIDPHLQGLAPIMRRLGRVLDPDAGLWVPYRAPSPPPAPAPPSAPRSEARAHESEVERHLARAVEALAVAERQRTAVAEPPLRPSRSEPPPLPVVVVAGWAAPWVAAPSPGSPQPPAPSAPSSALLYEELVRRQPGSLLPFPRPYRGAPPVRRSGN